MSINTKKDVSNVGGFKSTIKGNIGNIVFKEKINLKKLNYIINNFEKYEEQIIKPEDKKYNKTSYDAKKVIYRFRDNITIPSKYENTEFGEVKITYKKGKNSNGFGRYFVKNYIGIQSLPRNIRHSISDGIYYDLDIINAQPSILYSICINNNINCPILKKYILNRDEVIDIYMKEYDKSRDDIKNKIISIMNGGLSGKYYLLKSFEVEINNIYEILKENDEYFKINLDSIGNAYKKIKNDDDKNDDDDKTKKSKNVNMKGAFLSLLLQTAENEILENILEYLEINGYIEDYNVSLIFDGCQIRKDPSNILKDIEKYILEQTKYNIILKIKPFDECINIPDDYIENIDENIELVNLYISKISDFLEKNDEMVEISIRSCGTHTDIAEICHKFFGEYIKYDINTENWYYCNHNNIWKKDKKCLILSKMIPKIITKIFIMKISLLYKILDIENNDIIMEKIQLINKILFSLKSDGFIKSVINRCTPLFAVNDFYEKSLDSKGNLFSFKNKVYDFNECIIRNIKPNDFIFTNTGYNYPLYDDIDVKNEILNFFKSIYINDDMIDYILDVIVLSMNGNRTIQEFNILTGTGSNGKSLLMFFISVIFGSYMLEINAETLTKPADKENATSELYKAKGKRLVFTNEPESSKDNKLQVGMLKKLAGIGGKETITARGLYENSIEFVIHFMLFILCNDKPTLSSVDGGISRRLRVVSHPVKFVDEPPENNIYLQKKNTELFNKFGSDIYRNTFILMLLERWKSRTRKILIFKEPEQVKKDSAEYIEASNEVLGYISEHYEITHDNNDKQPAGSLLTTFRKTGSIISNDTFKTRMLDIGGITWKKTKNGNFYFGIKRKNMNDFIDDE